MMRTTVFIATSALLLAYPPCVWKKPLAPPRDVSDQSEPVAPSSQPREPSLTRKSQTPKATTTGNFWFFNSSQERHHHLLSLHSLSLSLQHILFIHFISFCVGAHHIYSICRAFFRSPIKEYSRAVTCRDSPRLPRLLDPFYLMIL